MDMQRQTALSDFRAGAMATLPAAVAGVPFALLIGALAAEKGLSIAEAGLMSALVFAGSAQFIGLDNWQSPPAWFLLGLIVFAVNTRHIVMSASILRHMGGFSVPSRVLALLFLADEVWAFAEARAARTRLSPAFYAGLVAFFYASWVLGTMAGVLIGGVIRDPKAYGLDFAFIAMFVGLIAGFRGRPGFALSIGVSAVVATLVHLIAPGPQSIIAGAVAGVAAVTLRPSTGEGG